jgi:ATP-dependent DNA helicase RecG
MVDILRQEGSDTAKIEAKRATHGFPESCVETMSAFANTPGGGVLLLGLDEASGFSASGVYDPVLCQQALTNVARHAFSPPITVSTSVEPFEGAQIVVATVPEADRQSKPVRVRRTGKGYLRQYDGDYPLSDLEEQAFISQRTQPSFDQKPIPEAKLSDLDPIGVARYLAERRQTSPRLVSLADDELLVRLGVLTKDHSPTLAGLLTFGIYPQQFLPNAGIQASLLPLTRSSAVRALESVYLSGPIPAMLDDAVAWVTRVTGRSIVEDKASGQVRDLSVYPPIAVRELIANALVHRDYGPYALSTPVALRVTTETLTISNQGGLLGVTVESLGHTPSHLRNPRLAEILQSVASPTGVRVIERLGSGIPAVREVLAEAGLPAPEFIDQGVRFTAKISAASARTTPTTPHDMTHPPRDRVLAALATGRHTAADLESATGLSRRQVTYTLTSLTKQGLVTRSRVSGREYLYHLLPASRL